MKQPLDYLLDYLQTRKNDDWLITGSQHKFYKFYEIVNKLYIELLELIARSKNCHPPKIILAEREPVKFLASFLAACAAKCPVFLCNPDWGKNEWEQVFNLVQPDIVWGLENGKWEMGNGKNNRLINIENWIMIPTGGSSGKIKFTIHTWETLTASVEGFTEYFQVNKVNSFCILPLYHVSGLMQFIRSFTTGGKLVIIPFKEVEFSQLSHIKPDDFFISLVPTQLQRLLQNPELTKWLSEFQTVLLGGAPAWEELLEKARFNQIRLAPTYGMTETASQIATLKPEDFLTGKFNSGQILPHARISINQLTGNIQIQAKSLTLGYYPDTWENRDSLLVDDIGFLDTEGYLHIIGRSSNKIITGGENIYPEEIEAEIRKTDFVIDICVVGIPDETWGQALTAIYVPKNPNLTSLEITLEITNHLKTQLSKFKIPKHWISLPNLPRNTQGKINRQQLQKIAEDFITNSSCYSDPI